MAETKVIIDCDAGIDDALALIILIAAHKQKKIQIEAITCVNGNTTVDNVVKNVFRTLDVCKATDIPVYQGAYAPLVCIKNAVQDHYHGIDGFGDVYNTQIDTSKLEHEHAAYALNKIVSKHPNEVNVLCIGPLTNIALAIKMYPQFVDHVKEFYIMGGNATAQGNITPQAEFNFYMDPESVHIVFNNNKNPLRLLPWETCLKSCISHEWRRDVLGKMDKPCIQLMNDIEYAYQKTRKRRFPNYITCDAILAAILLKPEIAQNVVPYHADIELNGTRTRGQVVLDHLLLNEPNVLLIQDFDSESFKKLLIFSVDNLDYNMTNI
ncbi:inosine-uridine preferring nucleoside hydrolase-like [Bombus vosnesenskii]|uniref:Inosine-uridine preferring nucleoside hydrolase-like n=2 Tax=Pyrobombus TaxID=144703 RepID=A0A6J3JR61_9HYME|nr:inosine-uridine preferring nucleoside hydrolase-like [Bombus vancouverensis nearcticus]XP_033299373.1 inosine-uridine preferring nucleoside hydrolase-like [Bombus bifarius]XP_033343278.1 inosine-uridine preferring nucleoside hydrolase-like [Bombus vosnesenskii]